MRDAQDARGAGPDAAAPARPRASSPLSLLAAGARLVAARPAVLLRVYVALLALGLAAALPVARVLSRALDTSLASEALAAEFDLGALAELGLRPETSPRTWLPGSAVAALLFLATTLFLDGGVLSAYARPAPPPSREFFAACGAWFPVFARFFLVSLLALAPAALPAALAVRAATSRPSAWAGLAALVALLHAFAVRLVFDLARVHAVATGERRLRRALRGGLRAVRGRLVRLGVAVVAGALLAGAAQAALLLAWAAWVAPPRVGLSFVFGQALAVVGLAGRLLRRAVVTLAYHEAALLV